MMGVATAFVLLGFFPARFPFFLGGTILLALLGVGTTPPGFARIVTGRFDRGRGLALGIMISGLGLMATLDRFRAQHVAATAFAISAAGCLLLLVSIPLLDGIAALATGLTIGAELDIMAYLISPHFGLSSFARLYGLA